MENQLTPSIQSPRFARARFLLSLLLLIPLSGCFGAYTGGVDTVIARADRSDPVRAGVVAALSSIDQDFAPLLTGPLSASEKAAMIENGMKFKGMSEGMSSLDLLRVIEAQAENAQNINVTRPFSCRCAIVSTPLPTKSR